MSDRDAVVNTRSVVVDWLLRVAHRHCGQDGNRIAESDRRRMSFARQSNFPADVVGLAPMEGRICARRDAVRQRSAPLRPATRSGGAAADTRLIAQGG